MTPRALCIGFGLSHFSSFFGLVSTSYATAHLPSAQPAAVAQKLKKATTTTTTTASSKYIEKSFWLLPAGTAIAYS